MKFLKCWKTAMFASLLVLGSSAVMADVKMPSIFGNNMVLQRDLPLAVWGWAAPGEQVTVSFAGQTETVTAGANGKWSLKLKPVPMNKEAQVMTVTGKNKLTYSNVLVGDVWVCSGQSNMEWRANSTLNAKDEMSAANYPLVRHVKINNNFSTLPLVEQPAVRWDICTPQTAGGFTAVGFYFAREVFKQTGVPIGLINASWGGTRIEPWTPAEGFDLIPELKNIADTLDTWTPATEAGKKAYDKYIADLQAWIPKYVDAVKSGAIPPVQPQAPGFGDHQQPTKLFNSMVNPFIPYGIKGAIWYQGCSNGGEGESYYHKTMALVKGWRQLWNQGDFPFYWVQLANYQTSDPNNAAGGDGWAKLREAQTKSMSIPNTGMAVIIDIGEAGDIHPRNKQDVGYRLALWALAKDYGKKDIIYSSPIYKSCKVEGNKIRVSFDYAPNGLMTAKKEGLNPVVPVNEKINWISIAGADKQWYKADAVVDGNTIVVSSDKVAEPVAVRYAFYMNPQGANLYSKEGLPVAPFRTDNW